MTAWSDISSDGLWRSRRRCGHAATALGRPVEAGATGPAEAQFVTVGAALAAGSLGDFVTAAGPDPADVLAEHPVYPSESNPRPASPARICFIGRSTPRVPSRRPCSHP